MDYCRRSIYIFLWHVQTVPVVRRKVTEPKDVEIMALAAPIAATNLRYLIG